MPKGLKRYYGEGHLHFITCSCYRRRPWLGTPRRRDLFLNILEEVRQRYRFLVVGYVVMPEHFHVLMGEPDQADPSRVMQVLKQRVARRLLARRRRSASPGQRRLWDDAQPDKEHFWQRRFYDFNVWSRRRRVEKLRYMHRNPVKRGLVASPELWRWSSFRCYAYGEAGPVKLNERPVPDRKGLPALSSPTLRSAKEWGTLGFRGKEGWVGHPSIRRSWRERLLHERSICSAGFGSFHNVFDKRWCWSDQVLRPVCLCGFHQNAFYWSALRRRKHRRLPY